MTESSVPFRILPELDERNIHFWQGGQNGQLTFVRCQDCGYYLHPPTPICPKDLSKNLAPEAVSGNAIVASYTVNYQEWLPGVDVPYIIAIVEIVEQPELRLTTNIINCDVDDIAIGMKVSVVFEHHEDPHGDVWLPLFEPSGEK
ncbi:unannotated protein [freshwater metagenome]|jgi:uncharacterized OB-fold protein|uniref:Unannotated protein n=1 Tax=freshwater metagenome TaxID=449393 RepID=A0A6J7QH86_9ZZZZ